MADPSSISSHIVTTHMMLGRGRDYHYIPHVQLCMLVCEAASGRPRRGGCDYQAGITLARIGLVLVAKFRNSEANDAALAVQLSLSGLAVTPPCLLLSTHP